MSADFEQLNTAAAQSRLGRLAVSVFTTVAAAGRSSWSRRAVAHCRSALTAAPSHRQLEWCATAIAVAASGHLALRLVMPATVVPALPAMLFSGIAILAAVVALQPSAFARAWRGSRVARAFSSTLTS